MKQHLGMTVLGLWIMFAWLGRISARTTIHSGHSGLMLSILLCSAAAGLAIMGTAAWRKGRRR